MGQVNPIGEGGVPEKGLGKTRGEEGMPPDHRRHGRRSRGGGKIQARIHSVIEPTALASTGNGGGGELSEEARGTSPSAGRPGYNTGSLAGRRKG